MDKESRKQNSKRSNVYRLLEELNDSLKTESFQKYLNMLLSHKQSNVEKRERMPEMYNESSKSEPIYIYLCN